MQFADNLLAKEQMKVIKGGTDTYGGIYSGDGLGMIHCGCPNGMTITTGGTVTSADLVSMCGGMPPAWCVGVG